MAQVAACDSVMILVVPSTGMPIERGNPGDLPKVAIGGEKIECLAVAEYGEHIHSSQTFSSFAMTHEDRQELADRLQSLALLVASGVSLGKVSGHAASDGVTSA